MKHSPANAIQDVHYTDAHGGINPAISDSSTYTFDKAQDMADTFAGEKLDAFLYSRHSSPSTNQLCEALAALENTEATQVFASGMGAITSVIMQLCKADDHIVSSRTIYGGTYAFMKNFLPGFQVNTSFVDITDLASVKAAIKPETKLLYCEALSNPLLEAADLKALKKLATENDLTFVVDNTFTPLVITPTDYGADVVVYSLTKFINGSSDTVGGAVCGSLDFVNSLKDVNDGAAMLLGQTLDSMRSASVLKNLRTLPIRMSKHGENALFLAEKFEKDGLKVVYPGLKSHRSNEMMTSQINPEFGYSGLLTVDFGSIANANLIMEKMQERNIGSLAVSLGFYRTLFSASGSSTSSEMSPEEQTEMGLSEGLVRFSIGLDFDIKRTYEIMKSCIDEVLS